MKYHCRGTLKIIVVKDLEIWVGDKDTGRSIKESDRVIVTGTTMVIGSDRRVYFYGRIT